MATLARRGPAGPDSDPAGESLWEENSGGRGGGEAARTSVEKGTAGLGRRAA